jgi:hypothetical protein
MDELKKSTPGAADIGSEVHAAVPNEGNVTPETTPSAANLTENELEDVVGGAYVVAGTSSGPVTITASDTSMKRAPLPGGGGGH